MIGDEFEKKLKKEYPKLFDYFEELLYENNMTISEFCKIKGADINFELGSSWEPELNFIKENEHLHDIWML